MKDALEQRRLYWVADVPLDGARVTSALCAFQLNMLRLVASTVPAAPRTTSSVCCVSLRAQRCGWEDQWLQPLTAWLAELAINVHRAVPLLGGVVGWSRTTASSPTPLMSSAATGSGTSSSSAPNSAMCPFHSDTGVRRHRGHERRLSPLRHYRRTQTERLHRRGRRWSVPVVHAADGRRPEPACELIIRPKRASQHAAPADRRC